MGRTFSWTRTGGGGFVGTNCNFPMDELLVGVIGSVEAGERGGVVTIKILERGGFVGTKCFVERVFDLRADVNGGGEVEEHSFFGGRLGARFRTKTAGDLGDGLMVLERYFQWLARAEMMGGGIGRTSGFAFWGARSGGPLGVAPVCC